MVIQHPWLLPAFVLLKYCDEFLSSSRMVSDTALYSNKHAAPDITYYSYDIKVLRILQNSFVLLRMVHACIFMHNDP